MTETSDYQHYLALSSELFCTMLADGEILDITGPWAQKIGTDKSHSFEFNIFQIMHPEDRTLFQSVLDQVKKSDQLSTTEVRFKNRSGEYSWFDISAKFSDSTNKIIMRALDISKQKALLHEVESIKGRLELAVRAVKFGVWDWNIKTGKLIWDSYMYELFEINESDFSNDYDAFEKTLVVEDSIRVQAELEKTFQNMSNKFESEFRVKTKVGKIKMIKAVASCFYDFQGNVERLVGNNWDITTLRETQKKLRDARFEIEKFFAISLEPLCVATTKGYFKRVNKAFTTILGYSEEELTSQPFMNFVHPEDIALTLKEIDNLSKGVPTPCFENRYRTKSGGYRHFNWVVVPDIEHELLFAVVRDVTDQVRNQHKALQSVQMSSLGEMASGVAHEINNPLTIVQGKARLIEKAVSSGNFEIDKVRMDLQKIVSTTERIGKIVKGLRLFSRDSTDEPILPTSIRSIVEDVIDLSRERFKYHAVDLRVQIQSDINIQCRGTQIGQIVMNLLNNGHDAVLNCPEKWVEVHVKKINDRAFIEVTDSGIGITPEVADKMMHPFFTTKETGQGTGLGLSISKGIAEDHNGSLRFDPTSERTRFVLELPVQQSGSQMKIPPYNEVSV